ncbi:MAG: PQQ-binding-like beta-propeller repeat protein [Bryobacteraceae bacterium]|nr:PQQ-binding-like beta-propeller repeat protein [Bryobacteraceae bacterium]
MRTLFVFVFLGVTAFSADWPSFRGPLASGLAAQPPAGTRVLWKIPIPGLGHSSPVVAGGRIYLTSAVSGKPVEKLRLGSSGIGSVNDQEPHRYIVMALDAKTGKVIWERTAVEATPKIKRHVKASHANSTPATNGKIVVAFFGSEGLYAFDAAGKLLWKKDLGTLNVGLKNEKDTQWGFASSPLIWKDRVIVQCDTQDEDFVAAFDLASGKELWRTKREEFPVWSSPVVFDTPKGPQLITTAARFTYGLDPMTGKELWRVADETEVKTPTPVAAGGLLYIAGGYPPGRPFFALKLGSGEQAWKAPKGGPYTTTPIVVGEHLYILGDSGVLSCYDAKTGNPVYQQRVSTKGATFSASPVSAGGKLYLPSEDGDLHIVKAGPQFAAGDPIPFGEPLMATPAISGGVMYVRSQGHLHALGK